MNNQDDRDRKIEIAQKALSSNQLPNSKPIKSMYTLNSKGDYVRIFAIGACVGFILGLILWAGMGKSENIAPTIIAAVVGGIFNLLIALIKK